jgi:hypothetical protein
MIDKLLKATETNCTSAFTILSNNVLCSQGQLNPSGLLENIAQTAAAMSGYASKMADKTEPLAVIGDIRNFNCTQLPNIGDEIITEVAIVNKIFDVLLVEGKITLGNSEIASCSMKIFTITAKA